MSGAFSASEPGHVPIEPPRPKPRAADAPAGQGTIFDSFLKSKAFQDMVRAAVTDVLRSPQGQELIAKAVRRELERGR